VLNQERRQKGKLNKANSAMQNANGKAGGLKSINLIPG
jgi:hypothetical protein